MAGGHKQQVLLLDKGECSGGEGGTQRGEKGVSHDDQAGPGFGWATIALPLCSSRQGDMLIVIVNVVKLKP